MPYSNRAYRCLITVIAAVIMTACGNSDKASQKQAAIDTLIPVDTTAGLVTADPVTIKLSVDDARPFSKTYKPAQVVTLDDSTEDIVGVPAAIEVVGDTLYIIEPRNNPGFRAYLHDGRQLFSYSSVGSGPEDIVSPINLCVNDSLLSTFDWASFSLVFVDKNGHFVKRYSVGEQAVAAMEDKSGGIWTDYSNQEYETTRLSWKPTPDAIEVEVLPVPEHLKGLTLVSMMHFSRIYDGTINYVPPLDPRVYGLLKGKAWIKYELDFDGLWPDEEEIQRELGGNDWATKLRYFPAIKKTRVLEDDRWLVISFDHDTERNKEHYIHVYDKNSAKGITYRDDEEIYFAPEAISGNRLYIPTKEDTIAIIDLSQPE